MARSTKKPKPSDSSASAVSGMMMEGNAALAKAWTDIMSESARFLSERLKEDLETQQALLACKTPTDVMQVQSEFFRKAMVAYSDEAQRMFMMMTGADEETIKEMKTSTKRGYDDVPV